MNKIFAIIILITVSQLANAASVGNNKSGNTLTKSQRETSSEAWTFAIEEIGDKLGDIDSAVLTLRSKKDVITLIINRTSNGLYKISIEKNNKNPKLPVANNHNIIKYFITPPSF